MREVKTPDPELGPQIGVRLRDLRLGRGLSLSQAASLAGISKSALANWEADRHLPPGPPLLSLLVALEVDERQASALLASADPRHARIALADTPRGGPLSLGDGLRALRTRQGMSQAELARGVGVSQPTVARWERGDLEPGPTDVHAAAFALGATPEELVALTSLRADAAPEPDPYARYEAVLQAPHALTEVLWMGMEADLWRLASESETYDELLQTVTLHRADWYTYDGTPERTTALAERAMRIGQAPPRDKPQAGAYGIAWAAITTGQGLRRAARLIKEWEPQAEKSGGLAYAQALRAIVLAELQDDSASGLADLALRTAEEGGEEDAIWFARLQRARVLIREGQEESALAALDGKDDIDSIMLRAYAVARVGETPPPTWMERIRAYPPTQELVLYRDRLTAIERAIARGGRRKSRGKSFAA